MATKRKPSKAKTKVSKIPKTDAKDYEAVRNMIVDLCRGGVSALIPTEIVARVRLLQHVQKCDVMRPEFQVGPYMVRLYHGAIDCFKWHNGIYLHICTFNLVVKQDSEIVLLWHSDKAGEITAGTILDDKE